MQCIVLCSMPFQKQQETPGTWLMDVVSCLISPPTSSIWTESWWSCCWRAVTSSCCCARRSSSDWRELGRELAAAAICWALFSGSWKKKEERKKWVDVEGRVSLLWQHQGSDINITIGILMRIMQTELNSDESFKLSYSAVRRQDSFSTRGVHREGPACNL